LDSVTLIAAVSIFTAGLTIAIGSIGPALGEARFLVEAVEPGYQSPILVEPDRAGFGSIVHVLTAMAERDHEHRIRTTRGYGVEQALRAG